MQYCFSGSHALKFPPYFCGCDRMRCHGYHTFLSCKMEASASRNSKRREEADRSDGVFMETAMLEQRMRMEEYRTNFETLRAQHIRLQEVCCLKIMPRVLLRTPSCARNSSSLFSTCSPQVHEELQHEQTELTKQYHHLEAQSEQIISQLQTERDDKISECEQLRAKVKEYLGHRCILSPFFYMQSSFPRRTS